MRGKYFLHPVWLAKISMPRNRLGVFAHFLVIEFTNSPSPEVVVMIHQPYLRLQSRLFDGRPQMLAHILNFNFLWKQARGHPAVLICIHFVLRRYSVDVNTFCFICLQEFHNVVCIRAEISATQSSAQHGIVVLHPARRTPGRTQKEEIAVDLARASKNGKDVLAIMGNGESSQLRVRCTFVKAVHGFCIIARPDAQPTNTETHLIWMEKLLQQSLALGFRHLADHITSRVCKCGTEAEYGLF